jgi:hypothetical protein
MFRQLSYKIGECGLVRGSRASYTSRTTVGLPTTAMSSYDVPCILPGPTRASLIQANNGHTSGEAGIIADLALYKFSTKTRLSSNITLHYSHAPGYKQHATIQSFLCALPLKMEENGVRPRSLASRLPADGFSAPSLVLQPQEALPRSAEPPDQAIKPKRAQIGAACIVCQRAKTKVSQEKQYHVLIQAF